GNIKKNKGSNKRYIFDAEDLRQGALPAETRLHSAVEGVKPDQGSGKMAVRGKGQPQSVKEVSQSRKTVKGQVAREIIADPRT
ncbi:hypothetical protein ACCS53_38825, partial [Rhizobium ruizarguesonis]